MRKPMQAVNGPHADDLCVTQWHTDDPKHLNVYPLVLVQMSRDGWRKPCSEIDGRGIVIRARFR